MKIPKDLKYEDIVTNGRSSFKCYNITKKRTQKNTVIQLVIQLVIPAVTFEIQNVEFLLFGRE